MFKWLANFIENKNLRQENDILLKERAELIQKCRDISNQVHYLEHICDKYLIEISRLSDALDEVSK
jgi:hypothetical protein